MVDFHRAKNPRCEPEARGTVDRVIVDERTPRPMNFPGRKRGESMELIKRKNGRDSREPDSRFG